MIKKDYFIPKMFYKLLVPSVFSSVGFAFADMADALAVGNGLGEVGLAAIGLCLPVFMLINLFMDGFGIGGSVFFSQRLGEGDIEKAQTCFNNIWVITFIIGCGIAVGINAFIQPCLAVLGTVPSDGGVYIACRDYVRIIAAGAPLLMLNIVFANFLRNDNNAGLASVGFFIGNAIDILLNIVLVVFLKMGTKGAALATVIGSTAAVSIYLTGIVGKYADTLKIRRFQFNIRETMYCFKTGFATSVRHLLQMMFFLVINRLLMDMSGESGTAVFDLMYNISFLIIYVYNGVCDAMQPLVSTFDGENNEHDCRYVLKLAKRWTLILGAIMSALTAIFAKTVSLMFGISAELIPISITAVRLYCIGFAFSGMNIVNEKYYQSKDKFLPSFIIVILREFAVLILCAYIFAGFGIEKIWLMYPVTEAVTFIAFTAIRGLVAKNDLHDNNKIFRITVCNDNKDIETALNGCMQFCESCNASKKQKYAVTLVIEEICMSIIRNAMKNMSDGKIRITLIYIGDGKFKLNVLDNAVEFNPFSIKQKNSDNEFDIDKVSMAMIKNITQKFMYRKCSGFNSLAVQI